uniref:Uncharacterized protein n=1 Tax=Vespula pensylvanica TaxID=30213 RepID=A0A834U4X3_VESPE|nr:hypothetical protein H0235_011490 [Vespula pensylvanica]
MRNSYSNDKPRNQYSLGEDSVIHMRTMDTYRALTLTCVISLAYQNDESVLYPIPFAIHVSYAIHSLATCMRSLRNNETDRYFRNRESEIRFASSLLSTNSPVHLFARYSENETLNRNFLKLSSADKNLAVSNVPSNMEPCSARCHDGQHYG